jgi:hypothetical protein
VSAVGGVRDVIELGRLADDEGDDARRQRMVEPA